MGYYNAGTVGGSFQGGTVPNATTFSSAVSFSAAWTTTVLAIGTAQTPGGTLTNTTAAAAGAQQFSPMLELIGQGRKTNAPAASQETKWSLQTRPVEGAANPDTELVFWRSVNGGAYAETMKLWAPPGSGTLWVANGDFGLRDSSNNGFYIQNAIGGIVWQVGGANTGYLTANWVIDSAGLPQWAVAGNIQTTVGAAGLASALPALPTAYLKVKNNAGTTLVIPAYAAA